MGLHQIEKLLHSKRNNEQNEKQPTEWEKIFAIYLSVKEFIFRICKEIMQLSSQQI